MSPCVSRVRAIKGMRGCADPAFVVHHFIIDGLAAVIGTWQLDNVVEASLLVSLSLCCYAAISRLVRVNESVTGRLGG